MDPLLRVIKFIFEKNSKDINDQTIDSFFDNGISFPRFVELIFPKENQFLSKINKKPRNLDQIQNNNEIALNFLLERNTKVKNPELSFDNKRELMRLILIMSFESSECLQINEDKIIENCNLLLNSELIFTRIDELVNLNTLSSLLYFLTDRKFAISEDPKEIIRSLKSLNIDCSSDEITLDPNYKYFRDFFLIQIEIIFDQFSDYIDNLKNQKALCFTRSNAVIDEKLDGQVQNDEIKDDEIENDEIDDDDLAQSENYDLYTDNSSETEDESDQTEDELYKTIYKIGDDEDKSSDDEINFDNVIQEVVEEEPTVEEKIEIDDIVDSGISDDDIDEKKQLQEEQERVLNNSFVNAFISFSNLIASDYHREHKVSFREIYSITKISDESKNKIASNKQCLKFWNPRENNFYYLNGILYQKTSIKELKKIEKGVSTEKLPTCYKLFTYDETNYCWTFLADQYNELISDVEEKDQIIFNLILDSRLDYLDEVSPSIKIINQKINDEDISIYAFLKERKKDIKYNCYNLTYFLTIHVPEVDENHPNLQTIFYQIYVYLFMLSSLNIVLIDEEHFEQQINFVYQVKDMSNIFCRQFAKLNNNGQYIFDTKSTKLLFLYKNENKSAKAINIIKNKFNLKNDDNNHNIYINQIDFKNNEFHKIISNYAIKADMHFKKTVLGNSFKFIQLRFSEVSGMYIKIREEISFNTIFEKLKDAFIRRFPQLNSKTLTDEQKQLLAQDMTNEFIYFFPTVEYIFVKSFHFLIIDTSQRLSLIKPEVIEKSLNEDTTITTNINAATKNINSSLYMTENQIDNIIRSHVNLIKKKFFDIIYKEFNGTMVDLMYQKYYHMLTLKIQKDTEIIKEYSKKFATIDEERKKIKNEDFGAAAQRETNYVMREVESFREIEIIINSDDDLKDKIPPDF